MLDFSKIEKKYLDVKLRGGTTLYLGVPKKSLFTKLTQLKANLEKTDTPETLYDEISETAAEILSTNREGKKFTAAVVDKMLDLEDMSLLIREYGLFAGAIANNPN